MINVNEKVTCRNPETGQTITCGAKVFYSLYIEKGFEIVNRDNADAAAKKKPSGEKPKGEPASVTGSAADIAERLNLTNNPGTDPPKTPADNAGGDAETDAAGPATGKGKSTNEDDANLDGTVTTERESNRRDRGRG